MSVRASQVWYCHACGARGAGTTEPIWWHNDPESVWCVKDDDPELVTDGGQAIDGTDHDEKKRESAIDGAQSWIWRRSELTDLLIRSHHVSTLFAEIYDDYRVTTESYLHAFSPAVTASLALHTESTPCEVLTQAPGGHGRIVHTDTDRTGGDNR